MRVKEMEAFFTSDQYWVRHSSMVSPPWKGREREGMKRRKRRERRDRRVRQEKRERRERRERREKMKRRKRGGREEKEVEGGE